ncbi:peptide-methionine (R)-S-oxide reductase MsrB [soil metagenome]
MKTSQLFSSILSTLLLGLALSSCAQDNKKSTKESTANFQVKKSEEEWKKILTAEQYYVLRQKGTERPFTGEYAETHDQGTYYCAACHQALFNSETKFESGTGWPSFYQPIKEESVKVNKDVTYGMVREEVVCSNCGGHLGHVFDDGPKPTGLRYCMNSVSLKFEKK